MLNCPGCGAAAEGPRCTYCSTDLDAARQLELLKASGDRQLPLYHEGQQDDIDNLRKLADYVSWTDLEFKDNYILGLFEPAETGVRLTGFGLRDKSTETRGIGEIPWTHLKMDLTSSCIIHYITATLNAYGKMVEGHLFHDGWHGSLAEVIEIANTAVRDRAAKLQQHPELKTARLYPKSMWR
jgi:hypothetical protein